MYFIHKRFTDSYVSVTVITHLVYRLVFRITCASLFSCIQTAAAAGQLAIDKCVYDVDLSRLYRWFLRQPWKRRHYNNRGVVAIFVV